jgi:DHA2 family multidrug resistance protein
MLSGSATEVARSPAAIPVVNPWLVAIAVMSATFLEVLDTTVVNVSLPHIAGTLSASNEEATWVLTSYLVANAIVLPMTGWLAGMFGRKRLLLGSVAGFTLSSFLCGLAPSLPLLIFFRIVQGATGGGLQPLSQAIMLEAFPPKQRGLAMSFWGLGIVVAPMLGPVFGGWLTENYSWRWVFYINIPIGLLAIAMTQLFVFDPAYIRRKAGASIDFWGLGLLIVGIGALQIMLDKGQQEDWFESRVIVTLAIVAGAGLIALVWRELKASHPVMDLRLFKDRTFASGIGLITVLGFVLYGSTVLLPLLMQTLLGYSAFDAGLATLPRGFASFCTMPLVGLLMFWVEARKLLVAGLLVVTTSLLILSRLSLDAGYWNFVLPLIVQGMSLGLLFIPLTTITNGGVSQERMGHATSIFNLMRNIGASIGIAAVTTILARRSQLHTSELTANVTAFSPEAQARLAGLKSALIASGADPATAAQKAAAIVFGSIQRQAGMMSYNDAFLLMAFMFASMLLLVPLMRKPAQRGALPGAH